MAPTINLILLCDLLGEILIHSQGLNSHLTHQYRGGQSKFTVIHMEKDMQVMMITIALLTQKDVTMPLETYFCPPHMNL